MQLHILFPIVVLTLSNRVNCETIPTNSSQLEGTVLLRKQRDVDSYLGLVSCAMKYDVPCFLDSAQNYLEGRKSELLAEADAAAARSLGRSDPDSKPSQLALTLNKLISEFSGLFKDGFMSFFKESREADDDENEENELTTAMTNGETRGKKKQQKKKLNSLLKLFAVGFVLYAKISLVLKIFHAALQFKFYLLAVGGLVLQALKLWASVKKEAHPSKVIYYENAHHQHHYAPGEDDAHSLWASRAFDRPAKAKEQREINNSKKKKMKKPLKSLIRLIKVVLVALIVVLKLAVLLKVLQTAMQFKFLLISLGGFAIQAAKFWMSIRNQKEHGHDEIVYKNPYTSGTEEYSSPGGAPYGAEYNARRRRRRVANPLAYSMQAPKSTKHRGRPAHFQLEDIPPGHAYLRVSAPLGRTRNPKYLTENRICFPVNVRKCPVQEPAVSARGKKHNKYDPLADGKPKNVLFNEAITFLKIAIALAAGALAASVGGSLVGVKIIVIKCLVGIAIALFVVAKKAHQNQYQHHEYHD
ncbi:hypothetical protein HUJ05_012682 [Dendroctonus ponderosae]|nr:hypothetical protein HUJ05_012682 [Dendroctonus ponderosae]